MNGRWSPAWLTLGGIGVAGVITEQGGTAFCYDATFHVGPRGVEWCVGTCDVEALGGGSFNVQPSTHRCMASGVVLAPSGGERGARTMAQHLAESMIRELLEATRAAEGLVRWANIPVEKLRETIRETVVH